MPVYKEKGFVDAWVRGPAKRLEKSGKSTGRMIRQESETQAVCPFSLSNK